MKESSRSCQTSFPLGVVWFGLFLATSQIASAQPLAVAHVQNRVNGTESSITSIMTYVGFGLNTNAVLFSQFALTPGDAGRTFTLDASNDPDFADAKFSLENGMPNPVAFGEYYGPGNSWSFGVTSEAHFFNPLPVGSNGIDFQGFQIGSIALTVDSLTLTTPGTNPNGTSIYFRGTIAVYAVPEPSVLGLLATGALLIRRLGARARRPT